nr:MAG TPA: hypothetical protein [Caudoviricetes sp.]
MTQNRPILITNPNVSKCVRKIQVLAFSFTSFLCSASATANCVAIPCDWRSRGR